MLSKLILHRGVIRDYLIEQARFPMMGGHLQVDRYQVDRYQVDRYQVDGMHFFHQRIPVSLLAELLVAEGSSYCY